MRAYHVNERPPPMSDDISLICIEDRKWYGTVVSRMKMAQSLSSTYQRILYNPSLQIHERDHVVIDLMYYVPQWILYSNQGLVHDQAI
jgi:hypothetical protein